MANGVNVSSHEKYRYVVSVGVKFFHSVIYKNMDFFSVEQCYKNSLDFVNENDISYIKTYKVLLNLCCYFVRIYLLFVVCLQPTILPGIKYAIEAHCKDRCEQTPNRILKRGDKYIPAMLRKERIYDLYKSFEYNEEISFSCLC